VQLHFSETEQPNLKLKTRPKQLLGSLLLVLTVESQPKTSVRFSGSSRQPRTKWGAQYSHWTGPLRVADSSQVSWPHSRLLTQELHLKNVISQPNIYNQIHCKEALTEKATLIKVITLSIMTLSLFNKEYTTISTNDTWPSTWHNATGAFILTNYSRSVTISLNVLMFVLSRSV